MSKIHEFVSYILHAAKESGMKIRLRSGHDGITITHLEPTGDLDRLLIDISNFADQHFLHVKTDTKMNNFVKNQFQLHGFMVTNNHPLEMERSPRGIEFVELELAESAPSNARAKRFIKHRKSDFKSRYGKNWKKVLYATAWKLFDESITLRKHPSMIHPIRRWMTMVESSNIFTINNTRVWQNPSRTTILSSLNRFGLLRGIAVGQDYWIWDAMALTHDDMANELIQLGFFDEDVQEMIFWITPPDFSPDDEPVPNSNYVSMELMSTDDDKTPLALAKMFQNR